MAKWTRWRILATKKEFIDKAFDNEKASCYELGLKASNGREIVTVYVGHTKNENNRMKQYGEGSSHIETKINKALNKGFILYYRAQEKASKKEASNMEKQLLSKRYYPWNTQLR